MQTRTSLLSLTVLALLAVSPANAADYGHLGVGTGPLGVDFSLLVERTDTQWRSAGGVQDTRRDLIGVQWVEPLAPRLAGGLSLGYIAVTQPGEPLLAGRELGGYFIGVNLIGALLQGRGFTVTGEADYRYHNADQQDEDQRLEMQWHEAGAGLGLRAQLAPGLTAYTGVRYGFMDGELLASGTLDQTRTFEDDRRETYVLGLEAAVQDGRVAVAWRSGQIEGISLFFRRGF